MQSQHAAARIALVDALRGVALACMVVFHFTWDLEFFGLANPGVTENLGWIWFAKAIAGTFLFTVGISLYLAHGNGVRWQPFLKRLLILVAAAAAITIASRMMDPEGTIYFGILHCIAASSVLGLAFLAMPAWLVAIAAAAAFAAPWFLTSDFFNPPGWLWLGLSRDFLPANDYVPLLPWLGNVLAGIAFVKFVLARFPLASLTAWQPQDTVTRTLTLAGQYSLLIYLVHQPLMIGAFWALTQLMAD